MEGKHYKEISEKLDAIIRLLAMQSLGDKKGREAISLLANLGFQPKDIATMIGTTPNTVSVALSEMKKKRKGK
jgi:DNA-binding CsgD family transcriptional regulator